MTFEELRDKAHSLPLRPGVYIMQNAQSTVIYVGKAKALRSRVSQYFQDQSRHNAKTRAMVAQIDHFDVIEVGTEFEALVLECALIKRYQPHYNILLKDDKGYPYIRLAVREAYPCFSLAARPAEDAARYFGPYGSRGASQDIIDAIRQALKLPSCSRRFPRDIGKERPCLNYHMGLCDGYCRPAMDQSRYKEAIGQAVALLEGRLDQTLAELTAEMERAAEDLAFERAAQLRDRINALRLLSKRQKAVAGSLADTDAVGFYLGEAKSCFVVLHYVEGELAAKDWQLFTLPLEETGPEAVAALTVQYYNGRGTLPRQILLPCAIDGMEELERMLTEAAGRRVEVLAPQRGAKADLVEKKDMEAAYTHMSTLNKAAAEAMTGLEHIHACTDITGFGLLGHAYEMAEGSGVTIRLHSGSLPLMRGAKALAQMGIVPSGAYRNMDYVKPHLSVMPGVPQELVDLCADPQTSGGLLVALPPQEAAILLERLALCAPWSALVGEVLPLGQTSLVLD